MWVAQAADFGPCCARASPHAPVCPVSYCSSLLRTSIALSGRCLCSWSALVFILAALPCTPPCRLLVPPARVPKRILKGMVACTCHVASLVAQQQNMYVYIYILVCIYICMIHASISIFLCICIHTHIYT